MIKTLLGQVKEFKLVSLLTPLGMLAEVIVELVGNAGEHGETECMLDIDITENDYGKKNEDGEF